MTILKKIGIFWETNPLGRSTISILATCFGLGNVFPPFSSTLGSIPGIAAFLLTHNLNPLTQSGILFIFVLLAIATSEKYEKIEKAKNPASLIIDKTAGMWASLFLISSADFWTIVTAFLLFMFFEYFKPFPINIFQGFKGGKGIVADDLAAGMITNLIVRILIIKELL